MSRQWQAPTMPTPVRATVTVPGSKSLTNRALVLSALARGACTVTGALRSRDTALMAAALSALGVSLRENTAEDAVVVASGETLAGGTEVDCGLAGTVMRFVPPVATLAEGPVHFDGDPRARERPMRTVCEALRALGADVSADTLPFTVDGRGGVRGGDVTIDASSSSQFVSALLLTGARYRDGITVRHEGEPLPSRPHIDMTVAMLRTAGITVDDTEPDVWRVEHGEVAARDWVIEPDLSNAAPFLAAAAVTRGEVTVPRWPRATTQAGDVMRAILARMGCTVAFADHGLTVRGPQALNGLKGIDIDLHDVGELTPTVAALAAVATGPSRLRGIGHLRGHETDRLAALRTEIGALGGDATQTDDGLEIRPRRLHGGRWHTYADHRMATAGAVVGLVTDGVTVDDIDCTSKTMPDFPGMWERVARGDPRVGSGGAQT